MKVTIRFNQYRREKRTDLECENCQAKKTIKSSYDDTNYWIDVDPNVRCEECERTPDELGIRPEITSIIKEEL